MAMRPVFVQVMRVELLDHDHGHWCRTCLLGTGIRVYAAVTFGAASYVSQHVGCQVCGGGDIEVNPHARHC